MGGASPTHSFSVQISGPLSSLNSSGSRTARFPRAKRNTSGSACVLLCDLGAATQPLYLQFLIGKMGSSGMAGMAWVVCALIPALGRRRQKDLEAEAIQGYPIPHP